MPTATTLSDTESRAWVGLLHAYASLVKQLDTELIAAHGLSLSAYEVLWRVAATDNGRLRMTDLAELVLLSPSGLSRLVDRLESDGMIERVACPTDGRAINATITELGRERLVEAQGTHFEGIRRRFLSNFSESEVGQLADFWLRLAPHCD
ncbi:MAG TPA: MarR family transcriptional regulator [Candidatus Dormibacteraeota bacterium]